MKKNDAVILIATIGGGFMGISLILGYMLNGLSYTLGHFLVFGSALILYGYFVFAGLCYAANRENSDHIKAAFLFQIPWFTCPVVSYGISSAFSLNVFFNGQINFSANIGSGFQMSLFSGDSWGFGVNFAAILLYLFAIKVIDLDS